MTGKPIRQRMSVVSHGGATGTTTAANLMILVGGALAGVVSARILGPAGRGQLAIATLWPVLIYTVGSLGMQSSCSYYFARWPTRRTALLRWLRRGMALQSIVMTAVSMIVLVMFRLDRRLSTPLVIEFASWAAAAAIALYGACCAQGTSDFLRFNIIRLIPGVLPTVLMLAAAMAVRLTPVEAGAAYVIPMWFSAVLASRWLYRAAKAGLPGEPLAPDERRAFMSYGWRSLASFSGLTLNRNADQLTLGLLVPASSLGIYSAAAAASSPLASMVASLGMVSLPAVAALTGPEKNALTWRAMLRALTALAIVSPALAVLLPWAIPLVYGPAYSAAVAPAEFLLLGAVFSALAIVADDLLRAHGCPGFVSVSQGIGGVVTVLGTLLLDGHPLSAVAAVSSLGYALALALAVLRLRAASREPSRHRGQAQPVDAVSRTPTTEAEGPESVPALSRRAGRLAGSRGATVPDRVCDDLLAHPHYGVRGDIEIYDGAAPDDRVRAYPARAYDDTPTRDPRAGLYHDAAINSSTGDLAITSRHREVMRSRQEQHVVSEEHMVTDIDEAADGVDEHVCQACCLADPDPRDGTAYHRSADNASRSQVAETAEPLGGGLRPAQAESPSHRAYYVRYHADICPSTGNTWTSRSPAPKRAKPSTVRARIGCGLRGHSSLLAAS
jgi:enterobacterial common antigen flippase